jgi:hypothetical protein
LLACESSQDQLPTVGYDYFPLEIGRYIIYDVSESNYSLTSPVSTKTYQLKETITSQFVDLTGRETYKIERSRRTTEAQAWQTDSVFTAQLSTDRAIKTEGNQSYIKILFPIRKGQKWNGNLLNAQNTTNYEIDDVARSIKIGINSFDNVLSVKQKADSSAVSLDKRTELFAQNIGLIFKESTQFFYCYETNCLGKGKIDYGTSKIMKIISYGKN